MTNKENSKQSNLETLVSHYQDTRAPLGFAERVMAHVDEGKTPGTETSPVRTFVTSVLVASQNHKFAYAASIGIVVLSSIIIVNSISNKKPDLQIAKQEKPMQTTTAQQQIQPVPEQVEQKQPVQPEKHESTMVATISKPVEPQTRVTITRKEQELFFQTSSDTDSTSLAVLTDVSDWLVEQKELTVPDISDLPDLNEIDNMFDTT